MTWLRRNPLLLALGLLAIALAGVLVFEFSSGMHQASAPRPRKVAPAEAKLLPPVTPVAAEQAYAETAARPIFVPTRRPPPEAQVAAAPTFQRGQFQLQGVIVAGNTRTAMLREKSGKVHRVEVGREVNGVKVVQIDPVQVTLGVGDEREVVPLTVQRPGAAPGAAAAAPPPAAVASGPFAPPPQAPSPGFQRQMPGGTAIAPPQNTPTPGFAQQPVPPGQMPGQPGAVPAPPPPGAVGTPPSATAPMTPEELLARRRARRAQQNQ